MILASLECSVRHQVADVLSDSSVANEGPVQQRHLPVVPKDQVLGPEVEVAERAGKRLLDGVQPMSRLVHPCGCFPQVRWEVPANQRLRPGVGVVEQRPVDQLLRAIRAKEATAEPWVRRERAACQELALRSAEPTRRHADPDRHRRGRRACSSVVPGRVRQAREPDHRRPARPDHRDRGGARRRASARPRLCVVGDGALASAGREVHRRKRAVQHF